jgi:hypothetical protein
LSIAFEAPKEFFLPRSYIRFQIANCYDAAGDLRRAVDEYRRLISDCDNKGPLKADSQLIASIYARLGKIQAHF